jgi:hypothetical protein
MCGLRRAQMEEELSMPVEDMTISPTGDPSPEEEAECIAPESGGAAVLFARVLVGLIVLICAEVFSGASLRMGLWHPWTVLVTYWLYLAHFFFLTTLAVRTGRTSLSCLYLWDVLFAVGLALSALGANALFFPALALNFIIWTLMGFLLTALSLAKGIRETYASAGTPQKIPKGERPAEQPSLSNHEPP